MGTKFKAFLQSYLNKQTDARPLAVFRIGFGLMMCYSILRFYRKGWIETLYLQPKFHFSYFGLDWIKPLGDLTYILFILCGIAAFCVAIGYRYRLAMLTFFLSFTYIELMDKTTYLNHYYFISILSFLMLFLPAAATFSLDNLRQRKTYQKVPKWTLDTLKVLLATVYFYAGLAKINSDWLFKAMPLKIWLPSKYDLPLIGETLLQQDWVHYAMSWGGMVYDISIPFLLLYRKTRVLGFSLVIIFHVLTAALFPIGMFPYIMIVSALVFFDSKFHKRIIAILSKVLQPIRILFKSVTTPVVNYRPKQPLLIYTCIALFMSAQLLIPFRYLIYPGELFWNERGYRFSWRVMLMEKKGETIFKVKDSVSGTYFYVQNEDFLTPFQEKQMSFQPDFILEYAHYLGEHFKQQGHKNIQIFADSFVALNGRLSQRFVDPKIDLLQQQKTWNNYSWITTFNDDIKGF